MTLIQSPKREALVQRKGVSSLSSLSSPPFPTSRILSESMVEETIQNAQSIVSKWDKNSPSVFHRSRDEGNEFLQTVKSLRHALHSLVSHNKDNTKLVLAQKLMQISMKILQKEFHCILSTTRNCLVQESISGHSSGGSVNFHDENVQISSNDDSATIRKTEQESAGVMSDLKSIADCMISCGYRRECATIYKVTRKSVVDEGLYSLGIERYRASHLHKMKKEALDGVIKNWLSTIKTAVRKIFNDERVLCDHVFAASEAAIEPCFLEIVKEGAINLFKFPGLIAKCKQSEDRMYRSMELYEAISDLWPDIDSIFSIESTSAIKVQALTSQVKLGESVRAILSELETTIQKDSTKIAVPGGGIHPLTHSVMSYISSLADYDVVLAEIVADHPPSGNFQLPESYLESPPSQHGTTSALSLHLARLILVLLCKLDSKSGVYKDMSLSYLFLANNLQFVVDRVHTTKLRYILGDDWIFSHAKKVIKYASTCQLMAWTKVFSSFPADNSPMVTPEEAKECFRKFNAALEEAYRKQTSWIIPDGKLRDEVKVSIAKNLVPVYQEFYDTYSAMLGGEEDSEVLVRFAPDDLENYLSDLFHGTTISGSSTPLSYSSTRLPGSLPRFKNLDGTCKDQRVPLITQFPFKSL